MKTRKAVPACTRTYIYMYMYIYIYIHAYIHTHTDMWMCRYIHGLCVRRWWKVTTLCVPSKRRRGGPEMRCVCVCVCVCACIFVFPCMHICPFIYFSMWHCGKLMHGMSNASRCISSRTRVCINIIQSPRVSQCNSKPSGCFNFLNTVITDWNVLLYPY
jgi:hypothetical protein